MPKARTWKHIVVAVGNPERRAGPAIARGAQIAAASGARLSLFHAYSPSPGLFNTFDAKAARAISEEMLARWRQKLVGLARPLRRRGLRVSTEVAWDYPVHEAVVRHVIETKADLLVADSHRHTAVARWVLTNTDWELIRQCPCPVWLAKSPRMRRKILAAVDPLHERAGAQRLDDRILIEARKAVASLGGSLAVCHADVPPVIYDAAASAADAHTPRVLSTEHVQRYSQKVRQGLDRLARRYSIAPRQRFVVTGDPAVVVPRLARKLRAGLLVMGAVSRSGLDRIFIGSTAERVIDDVDCDVLVVKPRTFVTRVRLKTRHS